MNRALLIIDVQRGLFDDAPRPYEAEAVLARINALSARARDAGVPVVYIQHERAGGFLEFGSESWQLQRGLQIERSDHVMRKTTPDSFLGTELRGLLERWQTREVVICGYASEFCVDTTTRRAAALGFAVTLVSDAHTTHDRPHASGELIRAHHNYTLEHLTSFPARIRATPAAEVGFSAQRVFESNA